MILFIQSVPQVGKLADLVLWKPAFFGAKPEMVIKGGIIAWANMGDPNASIPTPEPVNSIMPLWNNEWIVWQNGNVIVRKFSVELDFYIMILTTRLQLKAIYHFWTGN